MALRNTKIPLDAKQHIVCMLAFGERHRTILADLKEIWGVVVDRKAIAHYNPRRNPRLDPELKQLFDRTHQEYWAKIFAQPLDFRAKPCGEVSDAELRRKRLRDSGYCEVNGEITEIETPGKSPRKRS